ncbi:mTERF domain-containing protein, mitochondrial [Marchantia polymorpha subsp. ruderalis]
MSPSIKRAVHSSLGRLAVLSQRQGIAGHSSLPAISCRYASCAALPSRNVILLRAQPLKLDYGVAFVSVRFLGSTQLCSLETPEENDWQKKVDFLVSCSFTKEQAMQVLKQCPLLLSLSLEEELQPKIAFLRTLGVRDLPKVILFSPNLLLGRLELNLMPKVAFFESYGIQRQSIGKIIERFPTVLTYSIEGNMMSKTKFLESIGLERESIAKVIMRSPYIFALSIEENMRPKVKLLESIGVDKKFLSKLITRCPKIFCLSNEDNVLPKIKYLESIGVEKECMGKIVATCPSILNLSTSHIQQKLDFLQANNYCVKKVVNEFPGYLTYSLEHRIKPRHQLIAWLKNMGLLTREYSLCHILQISEKKFVQNFVQGHPQAAKFFDSLGP